MKILATLSGLMAIVMWGAFALLTQKINGMPPYLLLAMCFFFAALILPTLRLVSAKPLVSRPTFTWRGCLISISCLMFFHVFYFMALDYAPVIQVSMISYLWPMMLALLVAGKGSRLQALVGGVVGLFAVSLVLGWEHLSLSSDYALGYLFAFGCAVTWASYSFYLSKANNSIDDMPWLCLGVSVISLIISALTESWAVVFDNQLIFAIALLALGPVGGAFYCWEFGLKRGNSSLIASLSFSAPLISALLLASFGYAQWSSNLALALGLLISASIIINYKKSDVQKPQLVE
ncbi:EamA family transporter [Psychrobium sp. MM17-31]|uniref:DMT family transporter n=1 Tax=Psychrobium sp. MM17-31 TaxID=2917758 RepID=UPI001EF6FA6B|nr:EamA family transporter [Psychrobium sp. MM17-31]MCG7530480.1 EamA family transporter [Psychrobium sp. MM17-31]